MKTSSTIVRLLHGLILSWILREVVSSKSNSHRNVSELLDNLLKGYDNSVRPDFGGPPTIVEIDIMVRSMGPVSETEMTYSMDCYFRQSWTDARLSYSTSAIGTLALSISMLEKIWKPDTTIRNGKQSYLHTITTPNKFVRLYADGRVLYSSRLTIKASCPMDLSNFPMDTQRCLLKMGSFGYTTRDVLYKWNPNRTVDIAPDMKMSQFDLISTPAGNSTEHMKSGDVSVLEVTFHLRRHTGYFLLQVYFPAYLLVIVSWVSFFLSRAHAGDRVTLGEYSSLEVSFHLQRHMGNFLIQVYGPCTLLCVLSWVGFFLNREATSDRVSLGITTQFTITLLGLEARADLPKVPYPTALDFFVFISFAFIFASIIQFAIVHSYTKIGSGEVYFNDDSTSEDEDGSDTEKPIPRICGNQSEMSVIEIQSIQPHQFNNNGRPGSSTSGGGSCSVVTPGTSATRPIPISSCSGHRGHHRQHYRRQGSNWVICGKVRPGCRQEVEAVNSVSKVDTFARIFFPLSFITINIFYWYSYLYNTKPLV